MEDAIHGNTEEWKALEDTAAGFSDRTKTKLLEIQGRVHTLNKDYVALPKDKLKEIEARTFDKVTKE